MTARANDDTTQEWNWARTHRFAASAMHRPASIDELLAIIGDARSGGTTLRCVGSRHSFTDIADADALLELSAMAERFDVATDRSSVWVNGSMTYSQAAELLEPEGLALANTASLPHLTVAGAISTATHGSGDHNGNLATSVRSLEVATGEAVLRSFSTDDDHWPALPISLGALGAIVGVELAVQPAFEVEQLVHDGLSWPVLIDSFDAVFGSAYSVSVFTDWKDRVQLWTKRRTDQPVIDHAAIHDGTLATEAQHPVIGEDPGACTEQGPAGLWSHRLPHFRADAVPSVGAEVQSEFFVARADANAAIDRLRSLGDALDGILMASEIRTVLADDLWLSPQFERDSVAFHFTWFHDMARAMQAARLVADALALLSPIPHWGKVFDAAQFDFAALYPKLDAALAPYESLDPSGVFRNAWMRRNIL